MVIVIMYEVLDWARSQVSWSKFAAWCMLQLKLAMTPQVQFRPHVRGNGATIFVFLFVPDSDRMCSSLSVHVLLLPVPGIQEYRYQ